MRWIVRLAAALAVTAALAVAFVLLLPDERLARIVTDRLTVATGRTVTITGEVRSALWPGLSIEAEGLEIAGPDWAGSAPMLSAREVRMQVRWGDLFSGDIHVEGLVLTSAELTLVRDADGRLSWTDGVASLPLPVTLDRAEFVNSRVRVIDRQGDRRFTLRNVDAVIGLPEAGGAASLAGAGRLNGMPLELSVTVAAVAGLIEGESQPMRADLLWPGGTLRFDGRTGLDGAMEGRIALDARDLGQLMHNLGVTMPTLPAGQGVERMTLRGAVTLAPVGGLHLRNGVLRLDDTQLNLALDLLPGEDRPMLRGTITGGEIDLPAPTPAQPLLGPEGWSDAPLDVSGLFATDADLTIRAEAVQVGGTAFSDIDLRATVTRGRLVFDIARMQVNAGQVAGQFVINGRGGLSVGGDLIFANLDMAPTLAALVGLEGAEGRGSISFEFLGVGDELRTIMEGLEAEGDLSLGAGVLPLSALSALAEQAGHSGPDAGAGHDRIIAEFRIQDGVLQTDDMSVFAPWGMALGSGHLDLGNRTLDYRLAPEQGGVPILIRGSFTEPWVGPDPEALAERDEAARLLQDVRTRLSDEEAAAETPTPAPEAGSVDSELTGGVE